MMDEDEMLQLHIAQRQGLEELKAENLVLRQENRGQVLEELRLALRYQRQLIDEFIKLRHQHERLLKMEICKMSQELELEKQRETMLSDACQKLINKAKEENLELPFTTCFYETTEGQVEHPFKIDCIE